MNYKSINRFFVFTLALVTALAFFGVKPSDFHVTKNDASSIAASSELELNSIHVPGLPHPEGLETKEEQPSEEDDENLDTDDSSDEDAKNSDQQDLSSLIYTKDVISTSRGNFHCPLYIRIHSIII